MSQPVTIQQINWGYNIPKWSTEETQLRIRDLLETQVQLVERDGKTQTEISRNQKETTEETKKAGKQISNLRKVMEKTVSVPIGIIGALSKASVRLAQGLLVGGAAIETIILKELQRVIEFGRNIPVVGSVIGLIIGPATLLANVLNDAIQNFRELFNVGVSLNGSLINLVHYSAQAGLSVNEAGILLQEFSGVLATMNAQGMNSAEAFLLMQREIRGMLRPMSMLGMTSDEIAQYMGEYLELQRTLGTLEQLNQFRMASAITDYLEQLTRLSTMTGKRREQIAQEIIGAAEDSAWQTLLRTLPAEIQQQLNSVVGSISSVLGPEIGEVFKNINIFGSVITENGAILQSFMPELVQGFQDISNQVRAGALTQDEANKQINQLMLDQADEARALLDAYGGQISAMARVNPELAEFVSNMINMTKLTKEGLVPELDALSQFTFEVGEALRRLQEPFLSVISRIIEVFQRNGTLDSISTFLENTLERLKTVFENNEDAIIRMVESLGGAVARGLTSFIDWMDSFFDPNTREQAKLVVVNHIDMLFSDITSAVREWLERQPILGLMFTDTYERLGRISNELKIVERQLRFPFLSEDRERELIENQQRLRNEFSNTIEKLENVSVEGLTEDQIQKIIEGVETETTLPTAIEDILRDEVNRRRIENNTTERDSPPRIEERGIDFNQNTRGLRSPDARQRYNIDDLRSDLNTDQIKQNRSFDEMNIKLASVISQQEEMVRHLRKISGRPPMEQIV